MTSCLKASMRPKLMATQVEFRRHETDNEPICVAAEAEFAGDNLLSLSKLLVEEAGFRAVCRAFHPSSFRVTKLEGNTLIAVAQYEAVDWAALQRIPMVSDR